MRGRAVALSFGLPEAVFIVFLILKLLDKIDWSWWLVTAPLWLPTCFLLTVIMVWAVITGIASRLKHMFQGRLR